MTFKGRAGARGSLVFATIFFGVMSAVTLSLLFMKPFFSGLLFAVGGGCIVWGYMFRMTFQGFATISGRVILDANGITIQTGNNTRTILWSDISGISNGNRSNQEIKLAVRNGPAVPIQLFYIEDGKELGRILSQIVTGTPETGVQAVSASPVQSLKLGLTTRKFDPKPTAWVPQAVGILFFGAMSTGGGYTIYTAFTPGQYFIGGLFVLLFGTFFVVSIGMLFLSRTSYSVDSHGIDIIYPTSRKRIDWIEVESAVRKGSDMSSYRLAVRGRKEVVETSMVKDGPELIAIIDHYLAQAKSETMDQTAGRIFGLDKGIKGMAVVLFGILGPSMIGFGIYALSGGLARPDRPNDTLPSMAMGMLTLLLGLLFVYMIPATLMRRFTPHAHGLEAQTIKGTRTIDYDRLTRVELGIRRQPKSSTLLRTMLLEHPDGEVRIDSNIEDFGALQDYILAHVNPTIIRDSRPPGG